MNEKLGIENLKVAIVAAVVLAEKIEDKFADDGKISLMEALNVGVSSFGDVVKVIKMGKQIKEEVQDFDETELSDLLSLIKQELDFENEKLDVIVDKAIDFLVSLESLIFAIAKDK